MPLVCSSNPWWLQVYNTHERERRQNNSDCQKKSLLHLAESLWALELERTSYLILLLIVLFSTQVLHPDIDMISPSNSPLVYFKVFSSIRKITTHSIQSYSSLHLAHTPTFIFPPAFYPAKFFLQKSSFCKKNPSCIISPFSHYRFPPYPALLIIDLMVRAVRLKT